MNESSTDRIIRAALGVVVLVVNLLWVGGVAQIILWIVAGILLLTAAIGFCPLYALFRISTKNRKKTS